MSIITAITNSIYALDMAAVQAANQMAGKWPIFDMIVLRAFRLDSIRHFPLVAALIWAWYSDPGDGSRRRAVFNGVVGYMISIVVTRSAQGLMPHRPRPAAAGNFHFEMPVGGWINEWSSFPSDTAAQGFALAAAIWTMSRNLGFAAFIWTAAIICFPRLYGGFHYPSDLIAGGVIGLLTTWFVSRRPCGLNRIEAAVTWAEREYQPWFYIVGFFILFQIMAHLEDFRKLLTLCKQVLRILAD